MPTRRSVLSTGVFGAIASTSLPVWAQAESSDNADIIDIDDPRFERFSNARRAFWSKIGPVDDDVIGYLTSPQFQGKPHWPTTRQSYLIVRPEGTIILASDGLSDLFVNTDMQEAGFECEVYLETSDLAGASFEEIRRSWQFELTESFAQNVANFGGINYALDDYGVISMELPAPAAMPSSWKTNRDTVGALINMEVVGRPNSCALTTDTTIRIIPLTIILPDETEHVIAGGGAARREIADKLIASGAGLLSSANRSSVLA